MITISKHYLVKLLIKKNLIGDFSFLFLVSIQDYLFWTQSGTNSGLNYIKISVENKTRDSYPSNNIHDVIVYDNVHQPKRRSKY